MDIGTLALIVAIVLFVWGIISLAKNNHNDKRGGDDSFPGGTLGGGAMM